MLRYRDMNSSTAAILPPIPAPRCRVAAVLAALCFVGQCLVGTSGCSQPFAADPPGRKAPGDDGVAQPDRLLRNDAGRRNAAGPRSTDAPQDLAARAPRPAGTVPADDGTGLLTPLVRGLGQMVQSLPSFEQGDSDSLIRQLEVADDLLHSAKQSNREALKRLNRQLRIGAARNSPSFLLISFESWSRDDFDRALTTAAVADLPHLRSLLDSGWDFQSAYAAAPDVTTSRSGWLSGRQVTDVQQAAASANWLPEFLWTAGYETSFVGTWPLSIAPSQAGYAQWFGLPEPGGVPQYPEWVLTDGARTRVVGNQSSQRKVTALDLLTDEASAFLQRQRPGQQFLLHAAFPSTLLTTEAGSTRAQLGSITIADVDRVVGRLLSALETAQLSRHTCVILFSEVGDVSATVSETEQRLKVPLIVRWPGRVPAAGSSTNLVSLLDIFPTIAAHAASQRRSPALDGVNWTPLWSANEPNASRLLYWKFRQSDHTLQLARRGEWKVLHDSRRPDVRLFNLTDDPTEQHDVAVDHPDIVQSFLRPTPAANVPPR